MSAPRYRAEIRNVPCSSSPVSTHRTGLFVTTSVLPARAVLSMKSPTSNKRAVAAKRGTHLTRRRGGLHLANAFLRNRVSGPPLTQRETFLYPLRSTARQAF